MTDLFFSTYNLTLDRTGRIAIPKRLCEETTFYTKLENKVLMLFPESTSEKLDMTKIELDNRGRFNVRKYGFAGEVLLLGVVDGIEIYSKKDYSEMLIRDEPEEGRLAEIVGL